MKRKRRQRRRRYTTTLSTHMRTHPWTSNTIFLFSIIRNLVQGLFLYFREWRIEMVLSFHLIITLSFLCENSSIYFLRCVVLLRFGAPEGCSNFVLAKPSGLEQTHCAVSHVHQLTVYSPNKRVEICATFSKCLKDTPRRWPIS